MSLIYFPHSMYDCEFRVGQFPLAAALDIFSLIILGLRVHIEQDVVCIYD